MRNKKGGNKLTRWNFTKKEKLISEMIKILKVFFKKY
jgi:hypothetical protein